MIMSIKHLEERIETLKNAKVSDFLVADSTIELDFLYSLRKDRIDFIDRFLAMKKKENRNPKFFGDINLIRQVMGEEAMMVAYQIPNYKFPDAMESEIAEKYKSLEVYALIDQPFIYLRYASFSKIPEFITETNALKRVNDFNRKYKDIKFSLSNNQDKTYSITASMMIPCFEMIDFETVVKYIGYFDWRMCEVYDLNELSNALALSFKENSSL